MVCTITDMKLLSFELVLIRNDCWEQRSTQQQNAFSASGVGACGVSRLLTSHHRCMASTITLARAHSHTHPHTRTHTHTHTHTPTHTHTHPHTHTYTDTHARIHMYTRTHTCIHTFVALQYLRCHQTQACREYPFPNSCSKRHTPQASTKSAHLSTSRWVQQLTLALAAAQPKLPAPTHHRRSLQRPHTGCSALSKTKIYTT